MRLLALVFAALCVVSAHAEPPHAFPWAKWDAMLQKYVEDDGRVRYAEVDQHAVDALLSALDATSPHHDPQLYATKEAQLAYWIDGYNITVWASVLKRMPLETVVDDKKSFFESSPHRFGGESFTLGQLERDVVRKLGDGRVHMALNCASLGSAKLPRHAFVPEHLDAQLTAETKRFCNEKRNVDYDAAKKSVKLSRIFEWYKDDFGGNTSKVVAWINGYRDQKMPLDVQVSYADYDWALNNLAGSKH